MPGVLSLNSFGVMPSKSLNILLKYLSFLYPTCSLISYIFK